MLPIGGTFTYAAPSGAPGPNATIANGALHITAMTTGMPAPQYWGVGIYFNGNPSGIACIDATAHTGVQFDISGTIERRRLHGPVRDQRQRAHGQRRGSQGIGPMRRAYAPQAPLDGHARR